MEEFTAMIKNLPPRIHRQANILFGLDLTASREATLAQAQEATAGMFQAVAKLAKTSGRSIAVAIKLAYYGGDKFRVADRWLSDPDALCRLLTKPRCEGGLTQIGRLLRHALKEAVSGEISAVVFIGDSYEEKEDDLLPLAHKLKEASIPLFVFYECPVALQGYVHEKFRRLAEAAGGAYCSFNQASGDILCELLVSIAAFTSGGHDGLHRIDAPRTPEGKALRHALLALPPSSS
jgi:hypothetical protein